MNSSRIKTKRDKNNVLVGCVFRSVESIYGERGAGDGRNDEWKKSVSWVVSRGKVYCRCRNTYSDIQRGSSAYQ
jgi:hypothetical protein